jgi:hypothetical protein
MMIMMMTMMMIIDNTENKYIVQKWDSIKIDVFVLCTRIFKFYCQYWPDYGLFKPKLVANNRIKIQYYIVVSDVYIRYFI